MTDNIPLRIPPIKTQDPKMLAIQLEEILGKIRSDIFYLSPAGEAPAGIFFCDTVVFGPDGSSSTYTDLDLSSVVGNNTALVMLRIQQADNAGNACFYYVSTKGEESRLQHSGSASLGKCITPWVNGIGQASTVLVKTNANGLIMWKRDATSSSVTVTISVIAYWK